MIRRMPRPRRTGPARPLEANSRDYRPIALPIEFDDRHRTSNADNRAAPMTTPGMKPTDPERSQRPPTRVAANRRRGQSGSSSMLVGSLLGALFMAWRYSLDALYTFSLSRLIDPSGRWASNVFQELNDSTSSA